MPAKKNPDFSLVHENNIIIDTREIFLCGLDGYTEDKLAINFLKNLRILESISNKPIIIHQYNHGGEWSAGMLMFDAIQNSPCEFVFICYGSACSMGSILPQAVLGKGVRLTTLNCEWLIHDGDSSVEGNFKKTSSHVEYYQDLSKTMYNIYTDVCLNTGPFFKDMTRLEVYKFITAKVDTKEDWIFTGEDAVYYGFADAILGDEGFKDVLRIL